MSHRIFSKLFLLAALSGFALLIMAYYFEYALEMEPCPLCMTQRLAVLLLSVFFLLAIIPIRSISAIMLLFALVASLGGLYIADHHVYLQSLPADKAPACGPDLFYMLEVFPFSKFITLLLQGDGHCAEIIWSFLDLSMPQWTRICFTIYAIFAIVSLYVRVKPKNKSN